jgi:thiol-disulfide isomerase/thioredoxin
MKHIIFLLLIALTISCNEQKTPSFTINGSIEGLSSGKAFLQYQDLKDTVIIKNGTFKFKGSTLEPALCQIKIEGLDTYKGFYLENSEIDFVANVDSIDSARISGSKTEEEWASYNILLSKFDKKYLAIGREYESADMKRKNELIKLNEQTELEQAEAQKQFIKDNPSSYLCINILQEIDWSFNSAHEFNEYLSILDSNLYKYKQLIDLKNLVERMENVELGNIAPDFEANDVEGELVRLSELYSNSKYLLLDFWASHCGPCREENKYIKAAYSKFHDFGFDVISVSTDTEKDMWLMAIQKDRLTWTNVCNMKKWNENEIVNIYALRQISNNLLLNNEGQIIAKDLRGDNLEMKLSELLD